VVSFAGDGKEAPRTMGMREALRALELELGAPPPDYTPPVSTFPRTRAALEALRLAAGKRRRRAPATNRPATPAELGHEVPTWPNQAENTENTEGSS
jgi:hypothetical protein